MSLAPNSGYPQQKGHQPAVAMEFVPICFNDFLVLSCKS